ncbi:hypothetical protein EJ08DRAFT_669147 [Tothia fuscella]|uniref:Xylanolytic transcriptional activator regulatory domain-containing protein n=1 Tax=Tothia fuscella TaxID=1048955 RepID=A0A9P4U0Y6_9PEZI|nr:hypothetical protein EJ08DRAFT_669147 [Tothia fuscella]
MADPSKSKLPEQSLLKETLGHQNRQSSSAIGATTDFDPAITKFLPFNRKGKFSLLKPRSSLRRVAQDVYFELANLDAIEKIVAPHGSELVELYFRTVHPGFPILHKKVFLEKYRRTYRELTPIGLGAVYALALSWWSYNSKELEKLLLGMLFEIHARPKISDLQGALVLMQRPDVNSWALTGHVVSMAQNLGVNRDASDWHIPDWERGVRKRVAFALFMQDKWGALIYGKPSHIRLDDWDVQPLISSDFPETSNDDDDEEGSAEVEKGKQIFLYMVSLTEIVADILDHFFTLKALRRVLDISDVLPKAKPLQIRLKQWIADLPPSLSVDVTKARRLSSVGYLHLAYYTAEVTLHRAILRTWSASSTDSDIRLITRAAAQARFTSALEFAKRLKPGHLQSFWYFSSSSSLAIIGIFACILAATSNEHQERDDIMSRLAEYRWTLRISSNGAAFMKYAVGLLDGTSQLLEQQFEKASAVSMKMSFPLQEMTNVLW